MKWCLPYLRPRRRKTGGTIGLLPSGLLGLFFVMVGMRWAVVLGAALLLVGAAYVSLRGSSVEATDEEDVLDLADGDAEIDIALAPTPVD